MLQFQLGDTLTFDEQYPRLFGKGMVGAGRGGRIHSATLPLLVQMKFNIRQFVDLVGFYYSVGWRLLWKLPELLLSAEVWGGLGLFTHADWSEFNTSNSALLG